MDKDPGGLGWSVSFMIYYGYYFYNDSSGLQGYSMVELKSSFVWPVTCILFARRRYTLDIWPLAAAGAEATGVKWFGCTVDWGESTDSPLDHEDQVTWMVEHWQRAATEGACHCKASGAHLGPRLTPFCCGVLIKLLCFLDFRLFPWKVKRLDKESLRCTLLLQSHHSHFQKKHNESARHVPSFL